MNSLTHPPVSCAKSFLQACLGNGVIDFANLVFCLRSHQCAPILLIQIILILLTLPSKMIWKTQLFFFLRFSVISLLICRAGVWRVPTERRLHLCWTKPVTRWWQISRNFLPQFKHYTGWHHCPIWETGWVSGDVMARNAVYWEYVLLSKQRNRYWRSFPQKCFLVFLFLNKTLFYSNLLILWLFFWTLIMSPCVFISFNYLYCTAPWWTVVVLNMLYE